jgi:hypothetical protein
MEYVSRRRDAIVRFCYGEEEDSWFCSNVIEKKQILGFAQIDIVSLDSLFFFVFNHNLRDRDV